MKIKKIYHNFKLAKKLQVNRLGKIALILARIQGRKVVKKIKK